MTSAWTDKIPMHLDAFYVSMLSEKYRGNDFIGSVGGFLSGYRHFSLGCKM